MWTPRTWWRRLVHRLRLLLTEESSPKRLALAFGVGAFVGPTPTVGLHTVTAIGLAWVLRLNKVVTIAGSNVANPWTMLFFLYADVKVGAWLLGGESSLLETFPKTLDAAWPWIKVHFLVAAVGCVPVGLITALVSGATVYVIATRWHRSRLAAARRGGGAPGAPRGPGRDHEPPTADPHPGRPGASA